MSQRRLDDASEGGSVSIAPYEYAAVYDYLGKNRYLQAVFCKSVARLYSDKFGMYTTKALSNIAAEEGFIGVLEWSKDIGCRWDESLFLSGAEGGNVDILKFLKDNDCPMLDRNGYEAWRAAAERGQVEVLKFAYESNYLQNIGFLCEVAAENGNIDILEWVYEIEGSKNFNVLTSEAAASGGFIDVLQYLRSIGVEWDAETCWAAIREDHVDVLEWALDNGCPWSVNDRKPFGHTGLHFAQNVEVLEFLVSRRANLNAVDRDGQTPLHIKVLQGDLEAVRTLIRLGADVNIADGDGRTPLDKAIMHGYGEIAEVLRAAGAREEE